MGAQNWTVAEAKAKFSEIIERAMSEGRRQSRERAAPLPWWWEPKNGSERRSVPATWRSSSRGLRCADRT